MSKPASICIALALLAGCSSGSTGTSGSGSSAGSSSTGSGSSGSTTGTSTGSSGSTGSGASSTSGSSGGLCAHDAPGSTFTFHVHNGGAADYFLGFGCGQALPITLETASGSEPIGAGDVDFCENDCDGVFEGQPAQACSDCGPGVGASLNAGESAEITWDRRVYRAYTVDPACSGLQAGNDCALGTRVPPTTAQAGTLTLCTSGLSTGGGGGGYCSASTEAPFTVDTTGTEATIEIR